MHQHAKSLHSAAVFWSIRRLTISARSIINRIHFQHKLSCLLFSGDSVLLIFGHLWKKSPLPHSLVFALETPRRRAHRLLCAQSAAIIAFGVTLTAECMHIVTLTHVCAYPYVHWRTGIRVELNCLGSRKWRTVSKRNPHTEQRVRRHLWTTPPKGSAESTFGVTRGGQGSFFLSGMLSCF